MPLPFNFYDVLGLDPTDKKDRLKPVMDQTIDAWREKLNMDLRRNPATAAETRAKLGMEAELRRIAGDPALLQRHQQDYEERHLAGIRDLAAEMRSQTDVIQMAAVRRIARTAKLNYAGVSKAFADAGITVAGAPAGSVQLDEGAVNNIGEYLAELSRLQPSMPNVIPPDIAKAGTLYEFLAVYTGFEPLRMTSRHADAEQFRRMDSKSLEALFRQIGRDNSAGTTYQVYYRKIASAAQTIFGSGDRKKLYDQWVLLEKSGLRKTLAVLRNLPEALRGDITFAKPWIDRIQAELGTEEEEAYAVYNRACGLSEENRVEKEDNQIVLVCLAGSCRRRQPPFATLQQAQKARCIDCQQPLFRACPNCMTLIRNGLEECPACRYFLPGEHLFEQALRAFDQACRDGNLAGADEQMAKLRQYKPKGRDIRVVEQKHDELKKTIGAGVQKVERLIGAFRLQEARTELENLEGLYPAGYDGLRSALALKEREVQQKNREFRDCFDRPGQPLSQQEQVRRCFELLRWNPNFEPALEKLREPALQPGPAGYVTVGADGNAAVISWRGDAQNEYVTYTVVRSLHHFPQNPSDGTVVAAKTTALSCRDEQAPLGAWLFYAVFAVRELADAVSAPARPAGTIAMLPGISGLTGQVVGTECLLNWRMPEGCAGVQVDRREDGGGWQVREKQAGAAGFRDRGLVVNRQYDYRCTALWTMDGKLVPSRHAPETRVTVEERPKPVSLKAEHCGGGLCSVSWHAAAGGTLEIWALPNDTGAAEDMVLTAAQLRQMGNRLWSGLSSAGRATVTVEENRLLCLAAACAYGNSYILGKPVQVSTMGMLDVCWERASLTDDVLTLPVRVTGRVSQINVYVDFGDQPVWKQQVSGRTGEITLNVPGIPQRKCTVSVTGFTTENGTFLPSIHTVENARKTDVMYRVEWNRSFGRITGLTVSVTGSEEGGTPHCYVCCRTGNCTVPLPPADSVYDPRTMIPIVEIPGTAEKLCSRRTKIPPEAYPPGTRVKLVLAPDSAARFNPPQPEDINRLTKPN